jgi:hypothetical protein
MWTGIYFNNIDLSGLAGVQITKLDSNKRAKRVVNRKKLARQDGARLINTDYDSKVITINGVINGATRAVFEQNTANFFRYVEPSEAVLSISQGNERRNYTASVDETNWTTDQIGTFGMFSITFICSQPYGEATGLTLAVNSTGITTAIKTATFTAAIQGSYKTEPIISYQLSAYSSANANDFVKITDPATGKYIKVARAWVAGNILIINCSAKTVTVDGSAVDYSGVFLELAPGSMYIMVEDSFTVSRTAALKVEYKKREL